MSTVTDNPQITPEAAPVGEVSPNDWRTPPIIENSQIWDALTLRSQREHEQSQASYVMGAWLIDTLVKRPDLIEEYNIQSGPLQDPNTEHEPGIDLDRMEFEWELSANKEYLLKTTRDKIKSGETDVERMTYFDYLTQILPADIRSQPKTAKALRKLSSVSLLSERQAKRYHSTVKSALEDMSRSDFIGTLELHNAVHEEQNQILERKLPEILTSFEDRLSDLVQAGNFPRQALTNWEQRKDRLQFKIHDPFNRDSAGDYASEAEVISIQMQQITNSDKLTSVVFHELLHAISRQTRGIRYWNGNEYTDSRSIGLEQTPMLADNSDYTYRNRNLNEAITELGAELLLWSEPSIKSSRFINGRVEVKKNRDNGVYPDQRALLALMTRGELTYQDFFAAYFDQYDPNAPAGSRNTDFASLFTKLTQLAGHGFVRKLDKIYDSEGLHATGRFIEASFGAQNTKLRRIGRTAITRTTAPLHTPKGHNRPKIISPKAALARREQLANLKTFKNS